MPSAMAGQSPGAVSRYVCARVGGGRCIRCEVIRLQPRHHAGSVIQQPHHARAAVICFFPCPTALAPPARPSPRGVHEAATPTPARPAARLAPQGGARLLSVVERMGGVRMLIQRFFKHYEVEGCGTAEGRGCYATGLLSVGGAAAVPQRHYRSALRGG